MLRVEGIGKDLNDFALSDVSFDVEDGDYFVLLGASGVGKTVVLELLAGLTMPDTGTIAWDGEDITFERIQHRRMGLVYQDQALFPHMTVHQNIAFGLRPRKMKAAEVRDVVRELARNVNVSHLLHRYPGTLSGGESQRVALARTLATKPRCLLLDEPLSSLDTQSRSELQALLRSLHREGHTVIHVTHEYKEAMALATRVGIMESGTLKQIGPPNEVFQHPRSEFVARFVGFHNCFEGRLEAPSEACARFVAGGMSFQIDEIAAPGPGFLAFRSEDLVVSPSKESLTSRNRFAGRVIDVAPARLGSELTIRIEPDMASQPIVVGEGLDVTALVPVDLMERLGAERGTEVWVGLEASAARYIQK